ncbi:MAG TPA: hypothetical protein VGH90_00015 [Chthoniobacteraceae bacterium]|jgi:hypothetical protein
MTAPEMSDIDFSFDHPQVFASQVLTVGAIVFFLLTFLVRIAFAFGVYVDTGLLWRYGRRKTIFVRGSLWAVAVLLGGTMVAAIYWLIHHSSLRPQPAKGAAAGSP